MSTQTTLAGRCGDGGAKGARLRTRQDRPRSSSRGVFLAGNEGVVTATSFSRPTCAFSAPAVHGSTVRRPPPRNPKPTGMTDGGETEEAQSKCHGDAAAAAPGQPVCTTSIDPKHVKR
jgi:hypothetical protein